MNAIKYMVLFRLYKMSSSIGKRVIEEIIKKIDGGEMQSCILRALFKDYHGINIGMYSYGCFKWQTIPSGTEVGRYCSFASCVNIYNANHRTDFISTHPYFYNEKLQTVNEEKVARVRQIISNDVWIGQRAIILKSCVTIGNGAVIGAGAIVTKNVPAYAIVAGNPAAIIRYRFNQNQIDLIEESKWWKWDKNKIMENRQYMENIEMFRFLIRG